MDKPLVSVFCLAYNHAAYIQNAIEGFLRQKTNFRFEVLIHDDASPDGTADIIRKYAKQNPDVIVPILQEKNQYSRKVRITSTFLVPRARGKYVAFCEADDFWTDPDKLQKQIDYMQAHPECTLCVHACDYVNPDGSLIKKYVPYTESRIVPTDDVILAGGSFCHTASIVTLTELVRNLPDYYFISPVGDYPLQLHFASSGRTYYFADIMSAYRYNTPGSWTARIRRNYDSLIRLQTGIITMLQGFDQATGKRFHNAVEQRIKTESFSLLEYRNDYKAMLGKEYKSLYKKLPVKQRIKIRIGRSFPWLLARYRTVSKK